MKLLAPIELPLTTTAPAAPSSGLKLYAAENIPGRATLMSKDAQAREAYYQEALWKRHPIYVNAAAGAAGILSMGMSLSNFGTLTARSIANTNYLTRLRRVGIVTAASAGQFAGFRSTSQLGFLGDGTNGGFFFSVKFAASDATAITGVRQFVGLDNALTNVNAEPNTKTNAIGIAQLSTDTTQLYLVYGGSTAQAAIPLGTGFPPMTAAGATNGVPYEFCIYSRPDRAGEFTWELERLDTGTMTSGTIAAGTLGVTTPTVALSFAAWRCNNAQAVVTSFDIVSMYFDSPY